MQLIFDAPVRTHGFSDFGRCEGARADVVALFELGRLAFDLAHGIDTRHDFGLRPVAGRHDARCRQYRAALSHDEAAPLHHLLDMDPLILAIDERRVNRFVQAGLIAFDGQETVGALGYDLPPKR